MSEHYKLNEDKTYEPCDWRTWTDQFQGMERHVGDDRVNGKRISTVWLGNNHDFHGGPPLLLETMVFTESGNDIYMTRHTTWEEAEEGHKVAIQWVKDGCKDE